MKGKYVQGHRILLSLVLSNAALSIVHMAKHIANNDITIHHIATDIALIVLIEGVLFLRMAIVAKMLARARKDAER
jgi:hypothetical protein